MSTVLNSVGIVFPDSTVQTTAAAGASGVASVTASAPLTSSGGVNPAISLTGIVLAANGGTGVANTATLTITGSNQVLDQAVNSGATPTFTGTNFSNIPGTAISTTTPIPPAAGGTGISNTATITVTGANQVLDQAVNSGAAPTFTGTNFTSIPGTAITTAVAQATNLAGGLANEIAYQTAANTTSFLPTGSAGDVLLSNGSGTAPSWGGVAGGLF